MNIETMTETELVKFLASYVTEHVPVEGTPTPRLQNARTATEPFIFYRLARRMQSLIIEKDQRIKDQREELIEVRKELSKLKRAKA